jgi:hypothetical protein
MICCRSYEWHCNRRICQFWSLLVRLVWSSERDYSGRGQSGPSPSLHTSIFITIRLSIYLKAGQKAAMISSILSSIHCLGTVSTVKVSIEDLSCLKNSLHMRNGNGLLLFVCQRRGCKDSVLDLEGKWSHYAG